MRDYSTEMDTRNGVGMAAGAREENPVSAARNRVTMIREQVNVLTDQVRTACNVVFGGYPDKPESVDRQPPRAGEFGILHDALDALGEAVSDLDRQVQRLAPLSHNDGPVLVNSAKQRY